MKKNTLLLHCLLLSLFLSPGIHAFAQETDAEIAAIIQHQDSLFWQAYNTCDTATMGRIFSEGVEFYHDKGGLTVGLPALMTSMGSGMCSGTRDFNLRREAVTGTVKVYPLRKNKEVYGAIISGEHVFYITKTGKKEFLDGHAIFSNVWRKTNGRWQMARVFSYDHGPATYVNKRVAVSVPDNILKAYVGSYVGPQSTITITAGSNVLYMLVRDKSYPLYAEKENLFFSKDRDLTFEFVKTGTGVSQLLIREHDEVVETAEKKPASR